MAQQQDGGVVNFIILCLTVSEPPVSWAVQLVASYSSHSRLVSSRDALMGAPLGQLISGTTVRCT